MTFGQKLQQLRRKAGMSQDALAEQLDVSRQAVSKWERDEAMPETEKVTRVARLFGVSLDELLMDRVTAEETEPQYRQYEQFQYQGSARKGNWAERFVYRHGYKVGYIMMLVGALICVLSLIMYFVWPTLGSNFFGSFGSDLFGGIGQRDIQIDFGDLPEELHDDVEAAIRNDLGGTYGGIYSFGGNAAEQMESTMNSALKAQAGIFLIGLLPGITLLTVGGVVVIKGKKLVAQAM